MTGLRMSTARPTSSPKHWPWPRAGRRRGAGNPDALNRDTIDIYDREAARWAAARKPVRRDEALTFGASVTRGAVRVDVGCGAARYTKDLGAPVVALEASIGMLHVALDVA